MLVKLIDSRRFADAEDDAGILHREEALGHDDEEQDGGDQRDDGDHQGEEAMAQDDLQSVAIPGDDGVEDLF